MRSSPLKWLVGSIAFFLPAITVVVGALAVHADVRHAFWISMIVAAVIPPGLALSSPAKWRIALAFGLWVLLAVEFVLIMAALLAGFRE